MELGFFSDFGSRLEEREEIRSFSKELEDAINFSKPLKQVEEKTFLEEIQAKSNLSVISKNTLKYEISEILSNLAKETKEKGDLYFVSRKMKDIGNKYIVCKYENEEENVIGKIESNIPQKAGVNSILREQNDEYVLDVDTTKMVKDRVMQAANEIIDKQNRTLNEYRKDGHLYMVSEDVNNKVYLWDITDKPPYQIEEVNFPKELLEFAKEGTIFKYENGKYEYYSNDGFERIYN